MNDDAPGGAALLAVGVGEPHPLVGDPVDVRRPVAHQPVAVAAQVGDPDVVAPDDEDVRLLAVVGHAVTLQRRRARRHHPPRVMPARPPAAQAVDEASPLNSDKEHDMADDPVFVYIAAYDSESDAREDYEALLRPARRRRRRHLRRRARDQGRRGQGPRPQAREAHPARRLDRHRRRRARRDPLPALDHRLGDRRRRGRRRGRPPVARDVARRRQGPRRAARRRRGRAHRGRPVEARGDARPRAAPRGPSASRSS